MKDKFVATSKELIAFAYVQEAYQKSGDITTGLMPLFAPIIHARSGQIFNPTDFAKAVQEKYDIAMRPIVAESLIPKLVEASLLKKEKGDGSILGMPETSFNNRLAQRPKANKKRSIVESLDSGVFVSQAHNVMRKNKRYDICYNYEKT
ncbi:MAG: hypothetical protein Q8N09_00835 [Thermodesulfovibrionia bacterium]|nr:hypothetical protein [Thermodesulfovibrionia bacterium]